MSLQRGESQRSNSLDSPRAGSPRAGQHQNGSSSPRSSSADHSFMHTPPTSQSLLDSLNDHFFDDSAETFDAKSEALESFGETTDSTSVLERLLERVEAIDLARDAVSAALGNEVRRSAGALISGMRQVQDLDLDVTRTSLHVVAIRRRLALAKKDLHQAQLRIWKASMRIENRRKVKELVEILVHLRKRKEECDAVTLPLSACVANTIQAIADIVRDFPSNLDAVKSTLAVLRARIPLLDAQVLSSLRSSLIGPSLNESAFEDALVCLRLLARSPQERFAAVNDEWNNLIESYVTSAQGRHDRPLTFADRDESAPPLKILFSRVLDACKAFSSALRIVQREGIASSEQLIVGKRDALSFLARIVDDFLKSPLVRSQGLDDFAIVIEDASKIVDSLDVWFGDDGSLSSAAVGGEAPYLNKTKMESSIRLRARVYAQQYQAEGFQAMRGLLWRELWVDVAGGDVNEDNFANAIFSRLNLTSPPVSPLLSNAKPMRYVVTATMASGIPRQIQRTLDLMKKLPTSAAGESFLGLLRIVDLYLLAVLTEFVPWKTFMESRRDLKSQTRQYMLAAKEALGEWLVASSPRSMQVHTHENGVNDPPLSPRSPDSAAEEVIKLCELDFLGDESTSFETALVAARSLSFLSLLLKSLEKPLSDPLPSVERAKMASKMFVDVPNVILKVEAFVHRAAAERLSQNAQMPDVRRVYTGDRDGTSELESFRDSMFYMQVCFSELQSNPRLSDVVKMDLWDETCACFFDRYLNAIATLKQCSAMDRGNMILHLASFWESLTNLQGSKAMLSQASGQRAIKTKNKVDDFIKAFYYDKASDLWEWMRRRKDDLEPHHYQSILDTGLVGQQAGPVSYVTGSNGGMRAIGARKDLQQEFDKVVSALYT